VKLIRTRLTYANVMSSIAVFLILGGATAFAAKKVGSNEIKGNSITTGKIKKEAVTAGKIKKEAVTTSKIKNDAVTTSKIKNDAVTTSKIKNDAVTGAKVQDGSLTSVDLAAGTLTPVCPTGTVLSQGACFEVTPRAAATYEGANDACVGAGRRLPSAAELSGFTRQVQAIPSTERSGDLFNTNTSFNVKPDGSFEAVPFATAAAFRCVASPTP